MANPFQKTNHRETADDYCGEVWRDQRFRICECREGIQWLFQRQRPGSPAGGAAWDTLGYCMTKTGLVRLHRAHIGGDVTALGGFPETFPRRAAR